MEYDDDRKSVTKNYLFDMFFFDLFTSIPVSFFEIATAAACSADEMGAAGVSADIGIDSGKTRIIRVMKPIRFFKIARMMKVGRLGTVFVKLCDSLNISPKAGKTFTIFLKLGIVIHVLACMWWLFKVLSSREEDVYDFLEAQPWHFGRQPQTLHTVQGKLEAYAISCYLITMTLTTVGYGDIVAENTSERVGYVVLFIVGAFIWGTLLAEVGEVHATSSARTKEKFEKLQYMLEFLMDNDCPPVLRQKIVQWTRFTETHFDNNLRKTRMINSLPQSLRTELVQHIYAPMTSRVPVFNLLASSVDPEYSHEFLAKVTTLFEYKTYTPGQAVVKYSDPADRLIIIVEGKVDVEFDHSSIVHHPIELKHGDFIGDIAVLGNNDWGSSTCFNLEPNKTGEEVEISVRAHEMSFVIVLELRKEDFERTLASASFHVRLFVDKYFRQYQRQIDKLNSLDGYEMKFIRLWDTIVRKLLQFSRARKLKTQRSQNWSIMNDKSIRDIHDNYRLERPEGNLDADEHADWAHSNQETQVHEGGCQREERTQHEQIQQNLVQVAVVGGDAPSGNGDADDSRVLAPEMKSLEWIKQHGLVGETYVIDSVTDAERLAVHLNGDGGGGGGGGGGVSKACQNDRGHTDRKTETGLAGRGSPAPSRFSTRSSFTQLCVCTSVHGYTYISACVYYIHGSWMDIRVRVCPCKFHLAVYVSCMHRSCVRICVHVGEQVRAPVLVLALLRRRVHVQPFPLGLEIPIPSRWLHILRIHFSPIHLFMSTTQDLRCCVAGGHAAVHLVLIVAAYSPDPDP